MREELHGGKIAEIGHTLQEPFSLSLSPLSFSHLLRFDLIIKLNNERIVIKIPSLAEEIIPLVNEIL